MKDSWKRECIGDIADLKYGYTEKALSEGEYRYVRITDINKSGELTTNNKKYVANSEEVKKYVLNDYDLLMARTGATFAKVLLFRNIEPSIYASYLIKIDFRNLIENKLYWYYSQSSQYWEQANILSSGSAQPHFNGAALKRLYFNYPESISEQKQIVTILDKAFAAIDQAKANIEKNIQNAQELFQSKLNQIFSQNGDGWEERTLGELGTLTSSKRIFKKEYVNEGIPFYRSKEIKELGNGRDISLELFISEERYREIKSKYGIPEKGDILLTAVGTIGEMYIVKDNDEFYFKDGNIMWLKNFETLNSFYLKYALTNFVEHLKAISRGSAYNALTIQKLKAYSIPAPNQNVQERIVIELDLVQEKANQLENHYKEKLLNLDELKKSILQKAFTGELT